jgi:hypothetical protein
LMDEAEEPDAAVAGFGSRLSDPEAPATGPAVAAGAGAEEGGSVDELMAAVVAAAEVVGVVDEGGGVIVGSVWSGPR